MYEIFLSGRKSYRQEFLEGVEMFDQFARGQTEFINNGHYRCPCTKCGNRAYRAPDDVKLHLYQNGFVKGYWYWTSHGEIEPTEYANVGISNQQNLYDDMAPTSPMDFDNTNSFVDRVGAMVNDVIVTNEVKVSEQPNAEAQAFYDMFQTAQTPLWEGC